MQIPLLILGLLSTYLIQQYVKEKINTDNINLLIQTKENIELIFNELDSLNLYVVASATEFTQLKTMLNKDLLDPIDYKELASLKNFIDSPNIARPYIDSIYIYLRNDKGRFLSSTTGGLLEIDDFYDRQWYEDFIMHEGKETVWTDARTIHKVHAGFPKETVNLITMYRRISGENNGVIVLNINSNYIEQYLGNLSKMKDQGVLIVDQNNQVIFKNQETTNHDIPIEQLISNQNSFFSIEFNQESYIVSKHYSEKYGWTFVSFSPTASLYEVPIRLSMITLLLLLLSCIGGTILAIIFTKKNNNDIKLIITILNSVEKNAPLPPLPSREKNIYGYITHTILKNFMEQNYLKVQLSERKYKSQAMEFTALQSQLNPHFLFNTLETINWKAIGLTGRPNQLNYMIERLADILRYSLDGENKMVHMQKEILHTKSYIEIQKIRYKEKFDVIWDYDSESEKYLVIKLILQPLIENSLTHGLREDGNCLIKIKIKDTFKTLNIAVIDNGIGILPEKLKEIQDKLDSNLELTNHIGLFNTHKRLKLTYGEEYGLVIRSKYGWGTAIDFKIPKD
jgi:two-component system, sensor histidine kinase YesM